MGLKKKDLVLIGLDRTKEEVIEYYNLGVVSSIGEEGIYVKIFDIDGSLSDYDSRYRISELRKVKEEKALEWIKRSINRNINRGIEESFEDLKRRRII